MGATVDATVIIAFAALLVTVLGGFLALGARIGRLEVKIDTMWRWFTQQPVCPVITAAEHGKQWPARSDHHAADDER